MAYEGMDVDQVESLGHQLNTQANSLAQIKTKLDGLVSSMAANWDGADSLRFHDTWTSQYSRQVTDAITNLSTLSQVAIRQAAEQRQTSS